MSEQPTNGAKPSMLQPAIQRSAYAKVGIYGSAGSGKTFTAAKLAIGLHQFAKCEKPVGMFDTEPAAGYIIPLFKKAGIEFLVYGKSRALSDLMAFVDEAEQSCSVIIADSITHIWRDAQESFLAKINEGRARQHKRPITSLEFQHWRPIKAAWADFTDRFLSSKVHFIVCGRAGSIYEYQDKDDGTGKKELITVGTRMATEKELGYEPSLLIEMVAQRESGKIVNTALIQKDRADLLNGQEIQMPDFENMKAHFEALNIGGEHHGSMNQRDSRDMFQETGDDNWTAELRRRQMWAEEIKEVLVKYIPGATAAEKKLKMDYLERLFETRSWTRIENMESDALEVGFYGLKSALEDSFGKKEEPETFKAVKRIMNPEPETEDAIP
jgi:hypothetical protein